MDFKHKLAAAWDKNNSLLCVGLDPDMTKLPESVKAEAEPFFTFNKAIIKATADLVCAYKPNSAFYEALGAEGIAILKQTCDYLHEHYPDIPIIYDFKRGDIGNTNSFYATFAFDYLGVDAITVQPWSGREGMQSFLDYADKGIIVWCKGSNPGSGELQDLEVDGKKLYLHIAENVKNDWNENDNCLLVVGATYPKELSEVCELIGNDMVMLVPGIGAQGGDIEASVRAGVNKEGSGIIISTSREVLYASKAEDFADAARAKALKIRDEINRYRMETT